MVRHSLRHDQTGATERAAHAGRTGPGERGPMMHPGLVHLPDRPAWTCQACGAPWLCREARLELLDVYDFAAPELRNLLDFAMVRAVDDFRAYGMPRPAEIGVRLFGWLAEVVVEVLNDAEDTSPVHHPPRIARLHHPAELSPIKEMR